MSFHSSCCVVSLSNKRFSLSSYHRTLHIVPRLLQLPYMCRTTLPLKSKKLATFNFIFILLFWCHVNSLVSRWKIKKREERLVAIVHGLIFISFLVSWHSISDLRKGKNEGRMKKEGTATKPLISFNAVVRFHAPPALDFHTRRSRSQSHLVGNFSQSTILQPRERKFHSRHNVG